MSDIDLIKQMTMQHFVTPLDEFRANTRALNETHTTHVQQFQNIINSLFASADAIAELAGKYIQAANTLSDAQAGLSAKLADASQVCETTVAEISHDLSILPFSDPTQAASGILSAFVAFGVKVPLTWEVVVGTGLAAAATIYIIVDGEQQKVLDDMSRAEERWETDMLNVAMETEPHLPPNPTDPKPFLASPGSILYLNPNLPPFNSMSHEQLLIQDIMEELQRLGITANQSDVENLVKLGYDRARIISILSQSQQPLLNADKAQIDSAKFEKYSMNEQHPDNKGKWEAWGVLGYDVSTPSGRSAAAQDVLAQIRREISNQPATIDLISRFGIRYEVDIPVTGPSGKLVTIWQYDPGSNIPRLITNYLKV